MSKFIVLFSFFAVLTVVSCSSNPSKLPNSMNSMNSTNPSKNNDSEPVIYFHENTSGKDELESINFLNSSTIMYSFIRGETLISMEKWAYLINKNDIFIDSMKYQPTGTFSTGTFSNEKIVVDGKEFTRHINPIKK